MARQAWEYREVAVRSVLGPRSGQLRIQPMPGQAFATSMRVHCSRALSDASRYPAGTCFLLRVKMTDRQGGEPYLYAWHGDPVQVLTPAQAQHFLGMYRRLRL